jgi:thioesterase domain-containing protein
MNAIELENRIRAGIPLSANMDFRVLELSANAITVRGGASENINVHGTAFAGSLYAVCVLALWGLVNSRLPENTSLVLADGSIRYLKPVVGEIVSSCTIPAQQMEDFLTDIEQRGKARLQAQVGVDGENGLAVEFSGTVYARKAKALSGN